jgi:hypothetical protein
MYLFLAVAEARATQAVAVAVIDSEIRTPSRERTEQSPLSSVVEVARKLLERRRRSGARTSRHCRLAVAEEEVQLGDRTALESAQATTLPTREEQASPFTISRQEHPLRKALAVALVSEGTVATAVALPTGITQEVATAVREDRRMAGSVALEEEERDNLLPLLRVSTVLSAQTQVGEQEAQARTQEAPQVS